MPRLYILDLAGTQKSFLAPSKSLDLANFTEQKISMSQGTKIRLIIIILKSLRESKTQQAIV